MIRLFSNQEMKKLWDNKEDLDVAMILLMCYTGWRADEFINIKHTNTDPDDLFMKGGIFADRIVPIHWALHNEIFLRLYWYSAAKRSEYYLCNLKTGEPFTVSDIRRKFRNKMAIFHMNHRLEDTRLQFVHMCNEAQIGKEMIDYLTGIGTYDFKLSELKSAVDRIEYKGGLIPVYMW